MSHDAGGGARKAAGLKIGAATIAAFATVLVVAPASAQTQFTGVTGFGDSYADTGSAPGGAFHLLGLSTCPPQYPYCRFTGGPTTFVDSLQSIYGLPGLVNYAIGGARTDNTNTFGVPYGFQYELAQFAASGTRFTNSDLVALSIGGNDLSGIDLTGLSTEAQKIARIDAGATTSAQTAIAGVQQLVAAGARNIAWLSPGNSKYFPAPPNGPVAFNDTERDAFAQTYFQQIQQLLAPYAQSGVRVFLFNYEILQARIAADPGRYGFASDPTCQAYASGNPSCFYDNAVHPTSTAMALIARYMANQIDAPTTVVPQGGITTSLARGFANSVLDRLDADRTFQPFGVGPDSAMAMAYAPTKAPATVAPENRWSISGNVDYGSGSRDRQVTAAGYDYNSIGGSLAVGYRLDDNWRVGGVFGYSQPDVHLGVQNARDRIDAYQVAGYASFTAASWFADALVAYGRHDVALDRQGVFDTITADTSADIFTAAARTGHLFDAGRFRVGPIGGLTYIHAVIHGYTEAGDALLTMRVDRQVLDDLTGHAGVQVRYPFVLGNALCNPFVNLTAEHRFIGNGQIVTTTQVTSPLLPILTSVPDTDRTYGKLAAGVAAIIARNITANVTAATTFARDGGNDAAISTGIRVAF